ncbi:S-(hydroxymethyl)mycothiol dehydrogenase [Actinosynnema mirum]|uniref:Mycothiol-dependent formaldehyde dehydrogenase n=1 Tax=Actinosynnema mirum (strain ATCC 29888 / DSM 43827 / JCM 3225 / NBRC 14064 / NCIMB 13271 / NRRL B-12336 / IMRU 3971 / 101) TaxID=446462 RepID=C6WMW5_ACTMD|nr:S-(hydroxymethyl)mycothiol dehydrogenase [Actinosynnema mirum]ACU38478.1 mycothiol-dependent formaldehyde dehydrogenase [Actinosynnema mirum DSM 43827]
MSRTVSAVVAPGGGKPAELVEVVVPDPGPDEVTVRVLASGVCHTDLHYRDGVIAAEGPYLLGHEASGIVERVGPGVRDVKPGDFVVLNWRAVCGRCRACRRGRAEACVDDRTATTPMTLLDGTPLTPALGIGAFTELTLVHSGQCTPVNPAADPAVVCLLGCGVMSGLGAAMNTGGVRVGDTVAVIGVGGVGGAAVVGARLAGATTVVAVDRDERKRAVAHELGATDFVHAAEGVDVVARVRELTGGLGADVVVDAAGSEQTWRQAFYARALGGTFVLVARPDASMRLELPLLDAFLRNGTYRTSWYGDCLPSRDFPPLVELFLQDRLPLRRFVSERIGLGDVERAFESMRRGDVLRSVVLVDGAR